MQCSNIAEFLLNAKILIFMPIFKMSLLLTSILSSEVVLFLNDVQIAGPYRLLYNCSIISISILLYEGYHKVLMITKK